MSFNSPLLSNLRRAGGDDTVPPSPSLADDDFILRRRTPGGAERPISGPSLFSSRASHRPSPLGLSQPRFSLAGGTPAKTNTTPGSRVTNPAGPSTTTSTTGTNFRARLAAMQAATATGVLSYQRDVSTPVSASFTRPTSPVTSPTGLSFSQRSAGSTGPAPPPAVSLEDELEKLKLQGTGAVGDYRATPTMDDDIENRMHKTPGKFGGFSTATLPGTPITPKGGAAAEGAASSQPFEAQQQAPPLPFSSPIPLASASKSRISHWSPIISSTTTKGRKKALGAGALGILPSPSASTSGGIADVGTEAGTNTNTKSRLSIVVPKFEATTLEETNASTMMSKGGSSGSSLDASPVKNKSSSGAAEGAHSLQLKLRTELPEFGVGEWTAPTSFEAAKPSRPTSGGVEALQQLAALRNEAEGKLGKTVVDDGSDILCQGVRAAFRATLPGGSEKMMPQQQHKAVVTQSSPRKSVRKPAKEVEERLERLKLLREQADKVAKK